ncbi:hypothetical protein CODIS_40190 [Candidatus Thiodiazotropha endolucinida]|uniref:Uncharacterized protein n=1 Tax=Candidatus Thiodiazotropha endolucinida TaxID=1655433 RepID=A0A7Z1ADE3_9GAMM|nr:hypothetical protein CODIS_40190 [Candidatus Thiodiazotropha endolucinida]
MNLTMKYNISWPIFVFIVFALIGPVIRILYWPSPTSDSVISHDTIRDLVILLWPSILLTVGATNYLFSGLIAFCVHIVIFGFLGKVTNDRIEREKSILIILIPLFILILLISVWLAGFDVNYYNYYAVFCATALYMVMFITAIKTARRSRK